MIKYAGVAILSMTSSLDKIFTYSYDNEYFDINQGSFIYVPFGGNNKLIIGLVIEIYEETSFKNLKEVNSIINFLSFTKNQVELLKILRNDYLSTYSDSIRTMIPSCILENKCKKEKNMLSTGEILGGRYNKEPYLGIYKIVEENQGIFDKKTLSENYDMSISSINSMIKNSYLIESSKVIQRYDERYFPNYEEHILNKEQKDAFNTIINSEEKIFLLKGVTGSGKTEVYMHLVKEVVDKGRDAIILLPEISLTPQMVERFKGRFGRNITVYHSRLSQGEKQDEWDRVNRGEVKIAIGARSALFLPFKDLGLIVIDEEHESSYKSETSPKYDAIDLGKKMTKIYDLKIVLGSATPSVNSYYNSEKGDIKRINLNNRAYGKCLPQIKVVDLREELKNGNRSIFSQSLKEEMDRALENKEQILLFLNRRGFSSFVSCRSCGYVFKCEKCDVSMTYHMKGDYISCHYCGFRGNVPKLCPKCGSKYVKYFGIGTEKVEEEVKKLYNNARTIRMDYDTTREKNSYENIYNSFKNGEGDILIGTQMIAKGFDFRNVTLVGIIAADLSLNLPDYRAGEKTYQLITQVAGRSGRGDKEGKVIIQTYTPEHYSIEASLTNDYDKFYNEEINIRRIMNYPPFSNVLLINFSSTEEKEVINEINRLHLLLCDGKYDFELLGPSPCGISKLKERYRWQIILKGEIDLRLANEIKELVYKNFKSGSKSFKISIDINPNSFI